MWPSLCTGMRKARGCAHARPHSREREPGAARPGRGRGDDGGVGEHLGKLLALVLRHRPEVAGVALDPAGWVDVDELVAGLRRTGRRVTSDDVRRAVDADSKGRYELAHGRIRAAQGHSVEVDLGLEPVVPPSVLYHGTP